mgnify:CR=1 FL=1
MGKPSAPKPADPKETAAAQTATNIGTAVSQQFLNNVNQNTPYGSLTYDQTGSYRYDDPVTGESYDIPTFTATQTLSPEQQQLFETNNQTQQNLAQFGANQSSRLDNLLSRPIDTEGLSDRGDASALRGLNLGNVGEVGDITRTYGTDFSEDRQRVEDALLQRLQPSMDRDLANLESRLASQGIRVGSEAYKAAMDDYGRSTNDARLSAILAGGQEQSRLAGLEAQRAAFENSAQGQAFDQDLTRTQLGNQNETTLFNTDLTRLNAQNTQRNQELQEVLGLRNQPLNELTAILSGSQVSQPNFVNPNVAQIPTTDFASIQANYDNAQQQAYQQQMAARGDMIGGILGFGGNILAAGPGSVGASLIGSDRRIKDDVKKVGKTDDGQPIYSFRYKQGGPIQMGLMAQEVEKKKPGAVKTVKGIKFVDYGKALS